MRLYNSKHAPNARRVRIFLAEKGVAVPLVDVDLAKLEQRAPAFSAVNPFQRRAGARARRRRGIAESIAICRYFEELHPAPAAVRRRRLERAEVEMWQRWLELQPLLPIAQAFRHTHPAMRAMETPQITRMGGGQPRRARCVAMARVDAAWRDRAVLAGENFSVADITGLVALDFTRPARIAIPEEFAHLSRWRDELAARPSAKA